MHLAASALTLVLLQASPPSPVAAPTTAPATTTPAPVATPAPVVTPTPVATEPATQPTATQPTQPTGGVVYADPGASPSGGTPTPTTTPAGPYYYPMGAQPSGTATAAAPQPEPEPMVPASSLHRKLVFANFYGVSFSVLSQIPSGDISVFLGTNLRPRRAGRGFDWNTAIGYQVTASFGGVDRASLEAAGETAPKFNAIFVHRHHLMALGYGGRNQRLFYAYGGGAWFNMTQLGGVEAEGRLGYVIGQSARRIRGVVGGHGRLSGAFEGPPSLHIGLFAGLMVF